MTDGDTERLFCHGEREFGVAASGLWVQLVEVEQLRAMLVDQSAADLALAKLEPGHKETHSAKPSANDCLKFWTSTSAYPWVLR